MVPLPFKLDSSRNGGKRRECGGGEDMRYTTGLRNRIKILGLEVT